VEQVEEKEEMVVAFSWIIHDLPASLATDRRTTTHKWRYEIPQIHLEGSIHNKLGFVFTAGFCLISTFSRDRVRGEREALALEFLLMQLDST